VKERTGVGSLHERRGVKRPVARPAKPVVSRNALAGEIGRPVGQVLHAGVEVRVPDISAAEVRRRPGVHVAQVALAEPVIKEDLLPALWDGPDEREWQREVLLATQGKLEGLERVQLRIRRESKVNAGDAIQRLGEMLDDRPGGEGTQ
jgi:hypothetical protein